MMGWRAEGGKPLRLERPDPAPSPGEALVRTRLTGICGTDLEILRGYMGFEGILGHEFVGEVESCPGRPELVGRRVVGDINAGCGSCDACREGDPRHCPGRTVLGILGRDGTHATRFLLPASNLVEVPASVPDEEAVFAEPLAAALRAIEQAAGLVPGQVLVLGDGRLGLVMARALEAAGAEVTVLGRHERNLALVRSDRVRAGTVPGEPTERFPLVVEATGRPEGFELALESLRPRGTLLLKSTYHERAPLPMARVVVSEIAVLGSRCGRVGAAVEALAGGRIGLSDLVEGILPLEQADRAYERAVRPGALKLLLRP